MKRIDQEFNCDIHPNNPVFLIDLLQSSNKRLKCVKCISDQNQQILRTARKTQFLKHGLHYLMKVLEQKQINKLKNEDIDYYEEIIQFYDQFTEKIVKILSEKKKQQLIQAQKIYDLKDKIIEQYSKLADIQKLNECLNQENKQTIQIEEDLKQIIDSQYSKKNEYTSILSSMMKQYEFISKLNFENSTKIQKDICKIVETVNVIPQNNFNFIEEADMFSIERIETYKKKIDNELKINLSNQNIENNMMRLLNIIQNQLKFMNYQKNILFYDFIYISRINSTRSYISTELCPDKSVWQISFISYQWLNVQCFINKELNPSKKYEVVIQFNKSQISSQYYIGLIQSKYKNQKYLNEVNLGFQIEYSDIQQEGNTLLFKICIQDKLLQYGDFCEQLIFQNGNNSDNIQFDGKYYFGIQFYSSSYSDTIDIISFNELEEFS
ncbi:hypothetical protein ABPG74_020085 [Tetrahymena malaccensis]